MVHWDHLPLDIPEENDGSIFWGGTVVDHSNASGLREGKECLVIVYTSSDGNKQMQNLAYRHLRQPPVDAGYSCWSCKLV